jgi:guanylate kinase
MKIFLLTGPVASGKSLIMDYLMAQDNDYLIPIISFTTREKKNTEIKSKDYYFITDDEYLEYRCQSMILEQISFLNKVYGVTSQEIERIRQIGKNGIAIFTMDGIKQLKASIGYHEVVSIFIYRDLSEIISAVKQNTALSKEEQLQRIQLAKEQMKYINACDYTVFNIASLEEVYQEIRSIIRKEIDTQLTDASIAPGDKFTNQKGEQIEILTSLALNTIDGSTNVVYKSLQTNDVLISPYEKFISSNGRQKTRCFGSLYWPT